MKFKKSSFCKKSSKYFIGYKDDIKVNPLNLMFPKMIIKAGIIKSPNILKTDFLVNLRTIKNI